MATTSIDVFTKKSKRKASKDFDAAQSPKKTNVNLTTWNQRQYEMENKDEDECDVYVKLLAMKLRGFSKITLRKIMYKIDGLVLDACAANN